jgi:hypothetical protein
MGCRAFRIPLSAVLLAPLVACHTPSPRATAPEHTPPPPAAQEPADPSYDWHGLLIAPFGSVLKDIPIMLHEVLLFRDQVHGASDNASAADAECYATDVPAPRFVGRIPEEYLLCFRQDRLSRIRASVRLTAAEAPDVFAAACAVWSKNAAPTGGAAGDAAPAAPDIEATAAGVRSDTAPIGAACAGRDGAIRFRGRLEEEPGEADLPHAEAVLSITLDSPPNP